MIPIKASHLYNPVVKLVTIAQCRSALAFSCTRRRFKLWCFHTRPCWAPVGRGIVTRGLLPGCCGLRWHPALAQRGPDLTLRSTVGEARITQLLDAFCTDLCGDVARALRLLPAARAGLEHVCGVEKLVGSGRQHSLGPQAVLLAGLKSGERVVLDNLVKVRPGAPLVPRAPAAK